MRPRTLRGTAAVLVFAIVAGACASGTGASPVATAPSRPVTAPPATSGTGASPTAGATGGGPTVDPLIIPEAVLAPIVADAAARAGVDPAELRIVHVAAVEFNDGSLGCREPGMVYTQAIVPGWQVILEHDSTRIDYRASGAGAFKICATGGDPLPGER